MKRGRKKKVRYIQRMPKVSQFSPRGKPGRPDEIELRVDHFEAIKLADFERHNQSEGARQMGVSRPTFGRILRDARNILADALVNGKALRIRIGDVQVGIKQKILPSQEDHGFSPASNASFPREREQEIRRSILDYPNI